MYNFMVKKMEKGGRLLTLHWTLFNRFFLYLGQVYSLLLWPAFIFCFLPPFSKDRDAGGSAPLVLLISSKVINVVYSAELVCIPLVSLCKAI